LPGIARFLFLGYKKALSIQTASPKMERLGYMCMEEAKKTPLMETWQVYLLTCSDASLYCGITNDLDARILTHNAGRGAKYTRSRLPVELAVAGPKMTKSAALKFEIQIKKLPAEKKVSTVKRQFKKSPIESP
jgi:putative endonuclease